MVVRGWEGKRALTTNLGTKSHDTAGMRFSLYRIAPNPSGEGKVISCGSHRWGFIWTEKWPAVTISSRPRGKLFLTGEKNLWEKSSRWQLNVQSSHKQSSFQLLLPPLQVLQVSERKGFVSSIHYSFIQNVGHEDTFGRFRVAEETIHEKKRNFERWDLSTFQIYIKLILVNAMKAYLLGFEHYSEWIETLNYSRSNSY